MDLLSEPDLWQDDDFLINVTDANASSVSTTFLSPVMDKTINILMIIVLFITMVSLGCTMEVSKIKSHILKPKGVAIAVLSQYGIMPLTAFCLVKVGAAASHENIVMTTCSTILALGMMPLLLYLYCQGFSTLQNAVPYVDIAVSLVMILVPCGAGILLNYYRPQYSKIITKMGLTIMMMSVVVISIIAGSELGGSVLAVASLPLMSIGALMPFIGYAFGYLISSLFRLSQPERRTVAMETGCQNIQLCSTILKLAFPPAVIGPMFLFPLVYVSFQVSEAMVLIALFRCYKRFTAGEKESYQPATTGDKVRELSDGGASNLTR
ncbi:hepatic sodium/bile acid cotransporter [Cololabis saira]|uniref:hepatic sodium/bile acid cotransporter n=1 Tax=Cololabis saira TaxID=129043 RepID=UPI002AD540E9|nr:hepatic sodium/bile acid cotransporter [Cololabis saira]